MASKTVRCHLCQAALEESTIKRHISSFHLNYRPYDCNTCNENGDIHKAATEDAMDAHIGTAHSATNAPTSNEMGKGISIQEQNDDSQTVINKEDRLQNPTTPTQSASDARSLYSNPQSASDTKSKPAKKMELSMITIEISIDRGCASFETSDGKKYPSDGKKGPLSEYLSILRQSKKFEKFSQEINSIAHLWKYGRVVAELRKYPKQAKKRLALSDFCEGLFGQDRSILACKELEITLADCWPFSVVTNIAPSKRLILKEMHPDHLSEDQQLHCALLDALYKKKIPQRVDVILFLYNNKSTTEFNN
ncbi:hypothetical protein DdX_22253 [Ditylenchus destructor]|uniref:C2H2-type domain-containing protein n=1 Tax=Ditylenchus destructor TaxID=166010 RepID=A0AAD4MEH9_9BILA|nr:hypothetical protein DdX_22253 [Ditylenchus destructor]